MAPSPMKSSNIVNQFLNGIGLRLRSVPMSRTIGFGSTGQPSRQKLYVLGLLTLIALWLAAEDFSKVEPVGGSIIYLSLDAEQAQASGGGVIAELVDFPSAAFVPGVASNSLLFSTNSQLVVSTTFPISFSNGISMAMFVLADSPLQQTTLARPVDTNGNAWTLGIHPNGHAFLEHFDASSGSSEIISNPSGRDLFDNFWHYIVGVYDPLSSTTSLYVDGEADAGGSVAGWSISPLQSLTFGKDPSQTSNATFYLDEVHLYEEVLPLETISNLWQAYRATPRDEFAGAGGIIPPAGTTGGPAIIAANLAPASTIVNAPVLTDEIITGLTNNFCIEEMMRAVQERKFVSGLPAVSHFLWPKRFFTNDVFIAGGEDAGAYPADGFYCSDLANYDSHFGVVAATRASQLVSDLADKMADNSFLRRFIFKIDGERGPVLYSTAQLPKVTQVQPENHLDGLAQLASHVTNLTQVARNCVQVGPSGSGFPEVRGGGTGAGTCDLAKEIADADWAANFWVQDLFARISMADRTGPASGFSFVVANKGSVRGRIACDLSDLHGNTDIYLAISPQASGVAHNPPLPADGRYRLLNLFQRVLSTHRQLCSAMRNLSLVQRPIVFPRKSWVGAWGLHGLPLMSVLRITSREPARAVLV